LIARADIDFIVAGGARYGMGHVMRSGALAAAAARRGWRVRVFLAGDRAAQAAWRESCPESIQAAWSAWRAHASSPLTVFDHPFAKSRWIDACRRERTRAIVLDDPRAIGRARLTINPGLHHAEPVDGARAGGGPGLDPGIARDDDPETRVLRGPRYAILSAAHRATAHRPLRERGTLLLSLGGADPHAVTPRLAPILADALARRPADALARAGGDRGAAIDTRRVVLGPAFQDPDGAIARALAAGGWQVDRALAPAAMAARMAEARLAVMGFGTSLCELAWHGTPHLSVTHHAADGEEARRLEARGIGLWLGYAGDLDARRVAARFTRALADVDWQVESARRAHAAIEGGAGSERILDRLEAIAREIASRSPVSGLGHGGPSTPVA